MSEWEQRFGDASVWPRVDALRERLKSGPDPKDEEDRDTRERLAWLATLLDGYRETDPRLVTAAMLQSLDQSVAQVVSCVSQDTTAAWAQAASTHADAVVDALQTWPAPHKDRAHKATLAAADEMRQNAEKSIADMTAAAAGFREKVEALQASAAERSDAQDAALEELRTSLAAIEQRAEAETGRITAALEQNTTAAAEAEKARDETFKAAADDLKANVEDVLANAKQAADDAAMAREAAAHQHLATLTRLEEQAGELVDAISIEGTATGYGKYAEQERKAAWGWAIAAVVIGIAGFGVILWALHGVHMATSWREITVKLTASAALGGVATYCGNQSSQHREQERLAKRMQLDLAALNPFIKNLDPSEQDKLRAAFADRMFAQAHTADTKKTDNSVGLLRVEDVTTIARALKDTAKV